MPVLFYMINNMLIPYKPMQRHFIVVEDLYQRCCKASAANHGKLIFHFFVQAVLFLITSKVNPNFATAKFI